MAKRKVKISREREINTYSWLRIASDATLGEAKKGDDGRYYQVMASLIFTAFMMEAYLNHTGSHIFNCWGDLERLSPSSKLNIVAEKLGIEIDEGRRPYQTLSELFKFRNALAHGKSVSLKPADKIRLMAEPFDDHMDEWLQTGWEKYCTQDNASHALEDVEIIMKDIHERAGMTDRLFSLGMQGIGGTLLPDEQIHDSST